MCKVLFIGSNPSQQSSSITPFWGDTKSRAILRKWFSQLYESGNLQIESIHFANVLNSVTPGNRPLKMSEIKGALSDLQQKINVDIVPDRVVALGKTAEKALTLLRIPHYAMPHPSGLNRKLNDTTYVEEKINGLREYLKCQTATNAIDP